MKISKIFIISSFLSLLTLISVCFLWKNPLFLVLVLMIIGIIIITIGKSKKEDVYLYIAVFFWGALSEALAIYFGAWEYSLSDIIGIPIWLPFLWGVAGIYIKRVSLEINSLSRRE